MPALAAIVSVLVGWLATTGPSGVGAVAGVVAALTVLIRAPARLIVWMAGAGVLVAPGAWPIVASVAGLDVMVGDLLAILATLSAVLHQRRRPWWLAFAVIVVLAVWAALRSEAAGDAAFARIVLPLLVMLAVSSALPEDYDLRRDLRWFPIVVLMSVPLLGGLDLTRWSSIAGGSNETGLVGALAIILGFTYTGGWRYCLWPVGLVLLGGSAAIAATVATGAGLVYYAVAPRIASRRLGSGSPLLALCGIVAAAAVVPMLRVDLMNTIDAHLFQGSKLWVMLEIGNPTVGLGWGNVDRGAFVDSDVVGLHNVYLDVLVYLGIVGAVLFVSLLLLTWVRGDTVTRAFLLVWAVWVNTTGAFPGAPWGVLGMVITFAHLSHHRIPRAKPAAQQTWGSPSTSTHKPSPIVGAAVLR